jgi:hypothetical protein
LLAPLLNPWSSSIHFTSVYPGPGTFSRASWGGAFPPVTEK